MFAPSSGISDLQVKFVPPPEAYTTTNEIVALIPLDGAGAAVMTADQGIGFEVPGSWTVDISATLADGSQPIARVSDLVITGAGESTTTTTVAGDTTATTAATTETTAATAETTTPTSAP